MKRCQSISIIVFFFLMIRLPPRSTLTDTLVPYTTLFRFAVPDSCGIRGKPASGMTTENFGHLICDCPTSPPDRSADMLAPLLRPRSVAVIGASKGRTATGGPKLGAATLGYLIDHGFPGDRKSTRLNSSH